MSKSFSFPNMIDSYTGSYKSILDKDAVKQNLKLLLYSVKTELLGDPYYGTNLQKLIFDPNDIVIKDQVIDELYMSIRLFMKEITVVRKDITITQDKKGTVGISLKLTYNIDGSKDLYNIQLISNEEIE